MSFENQLVFEFFYARCSSKHVSKSTFWDLQFCRQWLLQKIVIIKLFFFERKSPWRGSNCSLLSTYLTHCPKLENAAEKKLFTLPKQLINVHVSTEELYRSDLPICTFYSHEFMRFYFETTFSHYHLQVQPNPKKIIQKNPTKKFPPKSKKIPNNISKNSQDFENIQFSTSHLEAENPFGLVF